MSRAPGFQRVLLTDDDVAALTQLSKNTLRNLRHQRRIPFVKLAGGAVRYGAEEIESWIDAGAQPAVPRRVVPLGRPQRTA